MQKQNRPLPVFLQVNTGEEAQKGGALPQDLPALVTLCRDELRMEVRGLMCIPPEKDIPDFHFAFLAKTCAALNLRGLSMGMSADFPAAIRFGASHVRVGSALF
jgi:uncharacterized pyridoxal phosphate-containing UPF0001 family protein